MYKIVIDANVWVKYARSKDIAPLLNRLVAYNLLPVANNYLLSEIFTAVVENRWMTDKGATNLISFIRKIALMTTENSVYRLSRTQRIIICLTWLNKTHVYLLLVMMAIWPGCTETCTGAYIGMVFENVFVRIKWCRKRRPESQDQASNPII